MADDGRRQLTWGTAIFAALGITTALVIIYGVGPSQFITRVNKSYSKIQDSGQSRFIRDMVSANYHLVISVFLAVGAYHIQRLSRRDWRRIGYFVLLVLPCIAFAVVPEILHAGINTWVSRKPPEQQAQALYDADLWVYTIYWGAAMGLFFLLTPGWIFGLKKLEERFSPDRPARTSVFGRPVVTST